MHWGNFFNELKRRNVYKVAVTYAVFGWLLAQIASLAATSFGAPAWVVQMFLVFLLIGFPIALILAWAFEMSPQGIIRTTSELSDSNPFPPQRKKPLTSNWIICGLILVIVAQFAYNRFAKKSEEAISQSPHSVAVMPFTNLSNQADQEYFSDGMMAEIINKLFRIEGLEVTSRTTSMRYKNSDKSVKEIAAELGVGNILEGDVMIVDDALRILVNLIDGRTDKSKWTDEYNASMKDIFTLQSEIARTVASKLQVEITPATRELIDHNATENPEAWKLLMQGRFEEEYTGDLTKAIKLLDSAIHMEPEFAPAYADLGFMFLIQGSYEGQMEAADLFEKVNYYLGKAVAYDPTHPVTYSYLAANYLWYNWDFEASERAWENYYRYSPPRSIGTNHDVGYLDFLNACGRHDEALIVSEEMLRDQPGSSISWSTSGLTFFFNGQKERALQHYEEALRLFSIRNIIAEAGRTYIFAREYQKAIDLLETNIGEFDFPRNLGNLAIAYHHQNQSEKSAEILNVLQERSEVSSVGSSAYYAAQVLTQMGRIDEAFQYLNTAYANHEVELYWMKVEPPFSPLYEDPRWAELVEKVGFPE